MTRNLPAYAIAYGLKGFGTHKHLRVKVYRVDGSYAFCHTASLADAGTHLVLSLSQIEWEDEWEDDACRHKDGLVVLS